LQLHATKISYTGAFALQSLTASTIVYLNSSKEFVSLANASGVLTNNGAGVFSWGAGGGGGSGITIGDAITSGTANRVLFENSFNQVSENDGLNYVAGGLLTVTSTTQQFRAAYDGSNQLNVTVGSTGIVTVQAAGTARQILVNHTLGTNAGLRVDAVAATGANGGALVLNTPSGSNHLIWETSGTQKWLQYIDSNDMKYYASGGIGAAFTFVHSTGKIIVGTGAAQGRLTVYDTSTSQASFCYDASNRVDIQSSSGGFITFTATGGSAGYAIVGGNVAVGLAAPDYPFHVRIGSNENFGVLGNQNLAAGVCLGSFNDNTTNQDLELLADDILINAAAGAKTITLQGTTILTGVIRLKNYTVATLPAAGTQGDTAFVTDATAPTYNAALVGGGAVVVPVFYNGAAWVSA